MNKPELLAKTVHTLVRYHLWLHPDALEIVERESFSSQSKKIFLDQIRGIQFFKKTVWVELVFCLLFSVFSLLALGMLWRHSHQGDAIWLLLFPGLSFALFSGCVVLAVLNQRKIIRLWTPDFIVDIPFPVLAFRLKKPLQAYERLRHAIQKCQTAPQNPEPS